jgi:hypothetical protein
MLGLKFMRSPRWWVVLGVLALVPKLEGCGSRCGGDLLEPLNPQPEPPCRQPEPPFGPEFGHRKGGGPADASVDASADTASPEVTAPDAGSEAE